MISILVAGLLMQQVDPSAYEGIARDDFAAWSLDASALSIKGQVKTASVMTRYTAATAFNGNPTPVAWSIHTVTFDCDARTATFISGANYSASGAMIYPATPTPATAWTDYTSGFQALATTVCALTAPL